MKAAYDMRSRYYPVPTNQEDGTRAQAKNEEWPILTQQESARVTENTPDTPRTQS